MADAKFNVPNILPGAQGLLSFILKENVTGFFTLTYDEVGLDSDTYPSDGVETAGANLVAAPALVGAANANVDIRAVGTGDIRFFTGGTTQRLAIDDATGNITVATGAEIVITDADALTVNGVIVPQFVVVNMHSQAAAEQVDQSFFIADRAYQVVRIDQIHAVAETTAATLNIQVTKDTGTNAPGAGTDLLTNNANAGFNGKATANTVQNGTLTAVTADLQLAAGNRLGVDFSAAATELVGVTITVILKLI